MSECIFCKIINKEIPAEIIYEDDNIIAILDAFPKAKAHTLIIPKIHYKNLLQKEDSIDLLNYTKEVAQLLQVKYKFDDFKVLNNVGVKAGQEVFHMHIHIIPSY